MQSNKNNILIFIDWFLPGYKAGGPIRSVANIVENLSNHFDFTIVTSDRDFGSNESYPNIEINAFIQKDNYKIIYLSPDYQNKAKYKEIINKKDFDVVYFNSLFSINFTLLPLRLIKKHKKNIKIILAPRGMLGQGALSLKKKKKKIFLTGAKILGLYNNITWHATDKVEVLDIKKHFGQNSKVLLVSNISEKIKPYIKKEKNITKFIFLSRIAEKKNLLFSIKLFQKIKTDKNIVFSIYGTNEDKEYLKKCMMEAQKVKGNISIRFLGELEHEKVNKILSSHHYYILPTLHENFGHSIFEAMSAGCPVIISDQTPWRNLESKGIGWDISLKDNKKFIDTIQKCVDTDEEEYAKMSEQTYKFSERIANDKQVIEQTKKMFE